MRYKAIIFTCVTLLSTVFILLFHYATDIPRTWDEVDFVLALSQFDLLAMQPHFPGYPYFILGGMLLSPFVEEPTKALVVFNVLLLLTASIPLFLIGKKFLTSEKSLLLVTLVQSLGFVGIMTTQPMSEGAAYALLWWYIWIVMKADQSVKHSILYHLLAVFLFSLLMGVRLSYLAFGVGLLFSWWRDWKKHRRMMRVVFFMFAAISFQFIWITALAATEGGFGPFLSLALSFTEGHFQDWGGSIVTENRSYAERLWLLIQNIMWTGFSSETPVLLVGYVVLISISLIWFKKRQVSEAPSYIILLVLLMAAYMAWAFFAQNIDKPRHILPLPTFVCFLLFYVCSFRRSWNVLSLFIICLIVIQTIIGAQLLNEQKNEVPAVYQLAHYMNEQQEQAMIYTWEETRIFEYLHVPFSYKRVLTYDYFLQDAKHGNYSDVFVTSHVVEGFKKQGINMESHLEKVKTFHSNKLFDPVYYDITLYRWVH
ncbi:nucleoporin-interacting protein [Metabacillus iocasae]|uniref:Nucleoporin-interacting protein n=1 Tax=Priestia iocasae TaxID=2291674 RepID=A0ABS2QPF6_9BACI|nr:nucleoporin-interacting protein [Metabacillus iocasae]MBM7701285.1 hypothetical protein [Metabacillus iocasae]